MSSESGNTTSKKILAVDDNQTNLLLYTELLEDEYCLETADCGETALEMLEDFKPDIILLDIMMPGLSGYEVCAQIREKPSLNGTKIILVSAKNTTLDRITGYEAGADDYLIKPFDEDELEAKINVFLRLKSMEEVDRLKSGVMALFSHETRTPLNGILGPLELLRQNIENYSAEERQKWLSMMDISANRLLTLFEKLLLLSNLRSGNRTLEKSSIDAKELLEGIDKSARGQSQIDKKTLNLNVSQSPVLQLDPDLIEQSIASVIENALQFSPVGGKVECTAEVLETEFKITVTDDGPGIKPEILAHLFDSFSRIHDSKSADGQSLSLSIANEVFALHGGSIVASNNEDGGCSFEMSLPLAA